MTSASLQAAKQPHSTSVVLLICVSAFNFLHDELKKKCSLYLQSGFGQNLLLVFAQVEFVDFNGFNEDKEVAV